MKNNLATIIQNAIIRDRIEREKEYIERERNAIADTIYLSVIALNRAEGVNLGKKRIERYIKQVNELSEWFLDLRTNVDDVTAHDKLAELLTEILGEEYKCVVK